MLDRHAPWRLVADITSPYMNKKMFKYGLSASNLFKKYFTRKNILRSDVQKGPHTDSHLTQRDRVN